jgi:hypothetical protein
MIRANFATPGTVRGIGKHALFIPKLDIELLLLFEL